VKWAPGADQIESLVVSHDLEHVEPSIDLASRLASDAAQHLDSARVVLENGDPVGAYQLAYDSLRKAAAALLAVQGLRATSRGGHVAVQKAMVAQFGDEFPGFRSFGRLRRNRNRFEYPAEGASEPDADDVLDAIGVAAEAGSAVRTVFDRGGLDPWR